MVTSLLLMEHWHAWIGAPAMMADAMLDRMLQQAHRPVLEGESLRTSERPSGALPSP
ncbi:ATP-binding protein [Parapusillimonas sp. JC17]|uniref:ATP-binding protein n=1 Tax=Parapusillimonas sp. JC17 TaxID=3445768 RepID=UPI003FA10596